MGNSFSKLLGKRVNVLVLGLKGVGKTTIIRSLENYYYRKNENIKFIQPTKTFEVKIFENICIWDLSGNPPIIKFWKCYYNNIGGIIFVIDCSQKEKIGESIILLKKVILDTKLFLDRVLIIFNKKTAESEVVAEAITKTVKSFKYQLLYYIEYDLENYYDIALSLKQFFERVAVRK